MLKLLFTEKLQKTGIVLNAPFGFESVEYLVRFRFFERFWSFLEYLEFFQLDEKAPLT